MDSEGRVSYSTLIGDLVLPPIHVESSRGSKSFSVSTQVHVAGQAALSADVRRLLSGEVVEWFVVSRPTIHVHFLGAIVKCKVHSNDSMTLTGSKLADMVAKNMSVYRATSNEIYADVSLTMASGADLTIVDESVLTFQLSDATTKVTVGYASVDGLVFRTGSNQYAAHLVLVRTSENEAEIARIISVYLEQCSQTLLVFGPVATNWTGDRVTCIDGTVSSSVVILGSPYGDTGVAGLVTRESEEGWQLDENDTDSGHVMGAYSTLRNCMAVAVRVEDLSAYLTLPTPFGFSVDIAGLHTAHCPVTTALAHMSTGPGMYRDAPTKTWLDIGPLAEASMFNLGAPMPGQGGWQYTT